MRRRGGVAPLVSVLLPARDAEATLEQAVASIVAQSWTDWELVLIDDGSTDRTGEIATRLAASDPRIHAVTTPPGGIVAALERGRALARGALLARMDADDLSHPERLALQVAWLEHNPEAALVGAHVRYFPREALGGGALRYEAWLSSMRTGADLDRDLWIECPIAHPTFLLRAAAVEAVGGYRDRGWPEDYDLLLRLRAAGWTIGVVPRVLVEWREGTRRLSRNHPMYAPAAFRRVRIHFLARTLLQNRTGLAVWGAGPVGKAFARTALEAGVPVVAFVDIDPRKIGQEIHGAPVIAPDEVDRFRGALGVAAVGQAGAREEIRRAWAAAGWVEGRDFVAVA